MSNSIRPFYLQAKLQQTSTNINSEGLPTLNLLTSFKSMVQNWNSSFFLRTIFLNVNTTTILISCLIMLKTLRVFEQKKWSKNLKLSMAEVIIEETKMNYTYLIEKAKTDK